NLSGKAVNHHLKALNIPVENLLVATDDLALPFGKLRMRGKGSNGGHNGLKNIEEVLGTNTYARLRFGVGDDFPKGKQVDYVLSPFSEGEFAELPLHIDKAIEMIMAFGTIGLDRTMSQYNQ
ncbi:MAG: peptidyl-tRNA hydrolase, partial [Chitinophagaceae bacterium]